MQFSELVKERYSVRSYKSDPVPGDKLEQVLEAARLAPTAANRQPFQLIVIHTAGREAELGRIYGREWFVQAPIVICVCGLLDQTWVRRDGKSYCDVDVTIVMDHLILAATDLGRAHAGSVLLTLLRRVRFWGCRTEWNRLPS